jgi:predicted dehydrogenase
MAGNGQEGVMAASSGPIGVGLIGCGMIGQIHADGLAKLADDGLVRPVAAADPSEAARHAVAHNCPFGRLTPDSQSVIDDDEVDAVMITAPTAAHAGLVEAVLSAGKPLFCEKPLAPSFKTVVALCESVTASGLVAQVGFHSRFHPLMRQLHRWTESGELGRPMGYTLRDDQYWPTGEIVPGHSSWRSRREQSGGGALIEHSIHSADILSWVFGPARRVYAMTRSMFGFDVEDTAVVTVEHTSGVVGTLITVFNGVRGREERRLEVFFEQGAVEITSDFLVGADEDSLLVQRPDQSAQRPDLAALREELFEELAVARRDFVFYQYLGDRAWLQAIGEGRAASPGFGDALAAHALVEAAYRAAATGEPVDAVDLFAAVD